jgi:glycosyltransferase involved in cell wall biosynthesis
MRGRAAVFKQGRQCNTEIYADHFGSGNIAAFEGEMCLMRVLAITNLFPNPWQPHRATFNRQQFEALAKVHEVRVIAPVAWTHEWAAKWKGRGAEQNSANGSVARKMAVEHPRYLFPPKLLRGWHGHCLKRCIEGNFWRAVNEFRPEVVLGAWAYPDGWAAMELGRQAGLPVVLKVHGSDVLLLKQNSARCKRTLEALNQAAAVVAVSRHLAGEVIKLGVTPGKVSVVHNGVDGELFCPGSKRAARRQLGLEGQMHSRTDNQNDVGGGNAAPLLLFAGNLVTVKGPDVLLEACALLAGRGVRFNCRFIGQGPMKTELERRISEAGLQDCVRLIGPRPLTEMAQWYRAADLVVLPSRSEGVPNVLLEANACAAPMIASDVGGVAEVTDSARLVLIPPDNVAALAQTIEASLAQPALFMQRDSQKKSLTWNESAKLLGAVLAAAGAKIFRKKAA